MRDVPRYELDALAAPPLPVEFGGSRVGVGSRETSSKCQGEGRQKREG